MRYFMTMLTVLGLDLGTKKWVEKSLPLGGRKVIVKNHLYLRHIKNRGMAYNTFSGKRKAILLSTAGLLSFYAAVRKGGVRQRQQEACHASGRNTRRRAGKFLGTAPQRGSNGFPLH